MKFWIKRKKKSTSYLELEKWGRQFPKNRPRWAKNPSDKSNTMTHKTN